MENKLVLKKQYIILNGFERIQDTATFCIYQGGVVISAGAKKNKRPWYYEVKVGKDRTIKNEALLELLLVRGFGEESFFAQIGNDYFEFCPHSI